MNYWERRQQELNNALEKDEAKLKKRLSSFYDTEYRKLEKEIAAYYSIYGENKVIEYRNLMQNLSDEDKEQLIKRMQDFVQLYPEYADLLPVRESIYKLNRLEGLQMSVRIQQYEMGAIDNEEIRRHLMRQAVRSANVAAETMGYGKNFYSEDSNIIKTVVNTKWSNGKDFSERIWGNVEKLAQYLNTDIAAGFARGDSYERMTRQLRQRFGKVSRNDAYRLIYTEGTFVMNEARAAAFEADTEEYIFRVQYDKVRRNGWRDICDDLNGEIFKWSERKPGINFPPMHPWCHCTATPHIANRQKWLDDYEKRHRNGQAEKVANRLGRENAMNLQLPNSASKINGLTPKNKQEIEDAIKKLQSEYDIHLNTIETAHLGSGTIFSAVPYLDNGAVKFALVLNEDIDYTKVKRNISIRYQKGRFAGRSIEDYIAHEMAHIMTYQDCVTDLDYRTKKKIIQKQFISGISGYADCTQDGAESLAEAFVRFRNGEKLPVKAEILVRAYIERWKK